MVGCVFELEILPKMVPGVPKSSPGAPDGTVGVTPATGDDLTIPNSRLRERQGSILVPFWLSFWSHFGCFFGVKIVDVFLLFFHAFWA